MTLTSLDHELCYSVLIPTRRQIMVSKVLVHENFTKSANDIALLRLGKKALIGDKHFSQSN